MSIKEKTYSEKQMRISRYAKALSHPARVFILDYLLTNCDKCCFSGNMSEHLPIARSTLSEHLAELKNAGLIQGEINSPYIKYCINTENWKTARQIFADLFDN